MAESQATAPTRSGPVWGHLNVFLAALVLLAGMGSFLVLVPVSLAAKLVMPSRQAETLALPLAYALMALGLAWCWWRFGLSPAVRHPARESRFRWGHRLLALSNLAMAAMLVLPWLGSRVGPVMKVAPQTTGLLMLLPAAASYLGLAGLIMVWSARTAAPPAAGPGAAFADTVPVGVGRPAGGTRPVPQGPPSRVPGAAAMVAGVLVSSLVLFVAIVFAAVSFQGQAERYTGVVLPIAGTCYLLYLAGTAWLAWAGERGAAIALSWAPALLLMVGLPALQAVPWIVSLVFGR
jgi:hypothetical protein